MKCPVCKSSNCKSTYLEDGLKAASCESCGGHWVAQKHYEKWLKKQDAEKAEAFTDVACDTHDVAEAKLCPDCSRILLKYKVGHGLDFYVEHCWVCGGMWFDRNEWNALKKNCLHNEVHKVFSTAWQKKVRDDNTASKMESVYRKRFGTDSYDKVKDIRKWLQDHPQREALVAYLREEDPYSI